MVDLNTLPIHILQDLDEAEYTEDQLESMSRYEIIDAWLKYTGIIGYTTKIINVCDSIKEKKE